MEPIALELWLLSSSFCFLSDFEALTWPGLSSAEGFGIVFLRKKPFSDTALLGGPGLPPVGP